MVPRENLPFSTNSKINGAPVLGAQASPPACFAKSVYRVSGQAGTPPQFDMLQAP
jgi:hypothetical protein